MKSFALLSSLLVLLTAVSVQAQNGQRRVYPTERDIDEWNRQDAQRTIGEQGEGGVFRHFSFIEKFIGPERGDWAVSLISEGGMFGSITLFSMNSDGKLLCGEATGRPVVEDPPAGLTDLVTDVATGGLSIKPADPNKLPERRIRLCSDCSYETFIIHRRVSDLVTFDKYPIPNTDAKLKKLYQAIPPNGGCKGS